MCPFKLALLSYLCIMTFSISSSNVSSSCCINFHFVLLLTSRNLTKYSHILDGAFDYTTSAICLITIDICSGWLMLEIKLWITAKYFATLIRKILYCRTVWSVMLISFVWILFRYTNYEFLFWILGSWSCSNESYFSCKSTTPKNFTFCGVPTYSKSFLLV